MIGMDIVVAVSTVDWSGSSIHQIKVWNTSCTHCHSYKKLIILGTPQSCGHAVIIHYLYSRLNPEHKHCAYVANFDINVTYFSTLVSLPEASFLICCSASWSLFSLSVTETQSINPHYLPGCLSCQKCVIIFNLNHEPFQTGSSIIIFSRFPAVLLVTWKVRNIVTTLVPIFFWKSSGTFFCILFGYEKLMIFVLRYLRI